MRRSSNLGRRTSVIVMLGHSHIIRKLLGSLIEAIYSLVLELQLICLIARSPPNDWLGDRIAK
jgi:hypothetical protein